ncbi:hypothetical protein ATANTOWER_002939 [Ataeniobius toweri]|uniref:Uncharacterized protein n=1 Tax=Ataeniobius toweri TaxID=208326 RepID=A0ABU7AWS3_9TELE|nr:hypothetical protein [Ataeniobius toweri]
MTQRNAPWRWDAPAQMLQMQQINHPGWRMPAPSLTPSALTTSSLIPLVLKFNQDLHQLKSIPTVFSSLSLQAYSERTLVRE